MKSCSVVLVACLHISVISVGLCYVKASAQFADTMECADESCSETISEGEARLAYRPRDENFLNLKKGDVVLVKSKNAGKKSHLWGGQDFLEGRNPTKTEDVYSGLVGENQKITIDKTKKPKSESKDKKNQETGLDEKARKEEEKLQDKKNDREKGTSKDVSMEDNDKEHPTSDQRLKEVELNTPGDSGRSQQEPEQARMKRSIEEHPDDGNTPSNVGTPASDLENAGKLKEENLDGESNGVQETADKQLKESEDGANDQRREEDGTMEEHQTSSDLKDSGNNERRHLDTTESKMGNDDSKQQKYASKETAHNEQAKGSDAEKQEAAKIPPDIAVLLGEDGVVGTELENEEIDPSKDSFKKGKSVARLDAVGHGTELDQEDVEEKQDPLNEKDQDTQVNKKSEDSDARRENPTKGEQESHGSSGVESTKAGTVPPPVDVDSSKGVDDGPFEDDVDFEEDYYDNDREEVEEETLPKTEDLPHGSSKTDQKIENGPTGQDSDNDEAAQLENASVQEEGENQEKEHHVSTQQSTEADVQDSNMKQNSSSTQENVELSQRESDPQEGNLPKEPESHRRPLEGVEEEKNGVKMENSPDEEGKDQGEDGKHQDQHTKDKDEMKEERETPGDEKAHRTGQEAGELDPALADTKSQAEHVGVGDQNAEEIFEPSTSEEGHGSLKDQTHTESAEANTYHQHHDSNEHNENVYNETTPDGQQDVSPEPGVADSQTYEDTPPGDKVSASENIDSSKLEIQEKEQRPDTEQESKDLSQNFPDKEGEHETNRTYIDDDNVQRKSDQSKTDQGDEVGDEHNSAHEEAHRAEERNIHHEEVSNDHDSAHGVDKGKTQFDEEPEHQADERKTHPDESGNNLDSDRKLVEEKTKSDKDNQYQAEERKTRAEEPNINHEEVGHDRDSALREDNEKTQFDEESEQVEQRNIHLDESGDDLDSTGKSVEEKAQSDKGNQHQAEENKAHAEEPSIHHEDEEVGNDRDSAIEKDKEKTQFDEESKHQAKERKDHPNESGDDLDSTRKPVEEKAQSDKDDQQQAEESKTRDEEHNIHHDEVGNDRDSGNREEKERIQFDEKSKHQTEERKTHPDESGDDLDSVPKHVEEKKQSDSVDQHQAKDSKTRHDESGVDHEEDDDERTQSEKDSHQEIQQGRTHHDEVHDERDSSHIPEEKQVQHEKAAVISGSNEHEVQARNTNSKPQASVESPVASNQEQQNVVPNEKSEDKEDVQSKGTATVLQMEAANLNKTAAVENEQVIKPNEPDSERYNALHEGEVVDWDEELDGKAEKEKSVGWDETLGGDDVGDSHFVPSSTEKTLEEEGSDEEDRKENVLSESPIEGDVLEHSTVAPQPLDVEQTTPTTPKPHPSETQAKSDKATDEELNEQGKPKSLEDELPKQQQEKSERGNDTEVGESEEIAESVVKVTEVKDDIDRELPTTEEMHVESFWLRLLLVLSNLPFDVIYILEPFFNVWVSLLPKEYHNDVHGASWTIVLSTFFIGFGLIWLLTCRSRSLKRLQKDERISRNIQELKIQLENLSQEKVQVENELRTKENEVEMQGEQMATASEERDEVVNEKRDLEHSLQEFNTENEALKRDLQQLNHAVQEKDKTMQEILSNSKQVEKSLLAQQEAIARYEAEIGQLQGSLKNHVTSVKEAEASTEKLKERIKNLEKSKGETKKEGKVMREQTEKLNTTINELQERLDAKIVEGEQKEQEIDVLKDCILQFKGAQDYLTDEGEDAESDDTIEKQKNKMKSMIDVANAKTILRQTEADKLQITYELEAERKSRFDIEAKIGELEALIQSDQAFKNKLERDRQMLESKLSVMQDFYAKREVEIQSKLGLEQSKRENNASMLEDRQKQHMEILQQLDAYKKMGEEAKHQYDEAERQHKQEILGFEKKAHDNWLACRDAERKVEEAHKQITQLHLELGDVRQRLRDSEREPILRPRPERHGPPGAPPPFGPPRRPPPPGMPGSPLHFRNGPEADRRSPPPFHRRPPSPSGSIPGGRPDRPPSTHSLPSMDRRPRPGPPLGPGQPYSPGRSYGDGNPPIRPPLRDLPPHARPPPGARMQSGPMTSSPYMERPPIPRSQSPGPRFQNFTQSSLHATPPHGTGEGLRNDGYQPPPPPESTGPPPPNTGRGRDTSSSNPFRRSRP